MSASTGVDPRRVIAELKELRELTGNADGAQRLCWTPTWAQAREWLREKLSPLPVSVESDEACNLWATLPGRSRTCLLLGGHLDSVPNGGWLDGALNVVAALEVLRGFAADGTAPVTVRLVDWADEEGARFGASLFGSSAVSGSIDLTSLRSLHDREGNSLPAVVARFGVSLDRARDAGRQLANAAAYLELHIEQGPVLEGLNMPLGAVTGTFGVERHRIYWIGQSAHAGSTPMDRRRDALAGAARLALEVRRIAVQFGGVCTTGSIVAHPGIATAVAGACEATLDQRHLDRETLSQMLQAARDTAGRIADEERLAVRWERIWRTDPIPFHPELIDLCEASAREVAGRAHRLPSGPLHDAAEVARAGIPTVMLFVQSLRGLSHAREEDTREEDLALSVRALDLLARRTARWIGA